MSHRNEFDSSPQDHEVLIGQMIEIPKGAEADPGLPSVMGQNTVAELSLGGANTKDGRTYDAEKVLILEVADRDNAEYRAALTYAPVGSRDSDYVLVSVGDGSSGSIVKGIAFVPTREETLRSVIGRQGTLKWVGFVDNGEFRSSSWTPFEENESVARRQLIITNGESNLRIFTVASKQSHNGKEAVSKTKIRGSSVNVVMPPEQQPTKVVPSLATKEKVSRLGRIAQKIATK